MTSADLGRGRLVQRLAIAILLASAALLAWLLFYLGPLATESFASRCDAIVTRSRDSMQQLAIAHAGESRDILVDVIQQTTESRDRVLADLPLSIYRGDIERIRAAIRSQDRDRSTRLQTNVQMLAAELQRRAFSAIETDLGKVTSEQSALNATFASQLRSSHLLLSGGFALTLLALLGVGLYRFVVLPVQTLRKATLRVAQGDLQSTIQWRSKDEIGALANDFGTMVTQLRDSRSALTSLNQHLETEVERKTKLLLHAEKMASIGTLAGGIAHEFNNLIGGIQGCTSELLEDETDAERRETLVVIHRATERARAITQQLLRFAKRWELKRTPIELATVADEALRLVEPQSRRNQVTTQRAFLDRGKIHADGDGLHQVFVNLFTNALQAMPRGGQLSIAIARYAEGVIAQVTDTGGGIPPEDIEHVFEPFFSRKDSLVDPNQRGTGLGLSVSYGIVEAHGGTLTVQSQLGRGTTFTIKLPVQGNQPSHGT